MVWYCVVGGSRSTRRKPHLSGMVTYQPNSCFREQGLNPDRLNQKRVNQPLRQPDSRNHRQMLYFRAVNSLAQTYIAPRIYLRFFLSQWTVASAFNDVNGTLDICSTQCPYPDAVTSGSSSNPPTTLTRISRDKETG
ncbi:hypothetical protein DPMN_053973 [Dreissena polymorpha]|uniref:Uncharacterized protein n=1 Tax=Dreissena polymorpha TaxID=45954 RepID=A0A9D4CN47_DREPO|nr:hypothetical protein DPMN_053973 [Dreissena polymorpha]